MHIPPPAKSRFNPLRPLAAALLMAGVMVGLPTPAQACQLVCIIAPGNLNDAGCSAAKAGFKVAKKGMLASLPEKGPEFYGSVTYLHGGISCADVAATAAMNQPYTGSVHSDTYIRAVDTLSSTYFVSNGPALPRGLTDACNARYTIGNESTVCCNM